jgi:iron complex transport system substrate-binding protein
MILTGGLLLLSLGQSCSEKSGEKMEAVRTESSKDLVDYAKGFEIQCFENYKKLIVKSPYPDSEQDHEYLLTRGDVKTGEGIERIQIPVKRLIATSTTHIPMLEVLGAEERLIGFPNTDFISSERTRALISGGQLTDIGKDMSLNAEMIIALKPDVLIAFGVDDSDRAFATLRKNGIPIVFNGDWLEETPLGRAEWIKFFGALLDQDAKADSVFKVIEQEYLEARKIAERATETPSLMSGVLFKDQWNLPAGESFAANLYRDANTDYLWKDSQGQGSLVLNFESVLEKAADADFWIGSGVYTRREDLLEANGHYAEFKAFQNHSVYTFSKRKGPGGGILYYELAPIKPHIVLKDLVKVTHPELLPDYEPFFLQKLD